MSSPPSPPKSLGAAGSSLATSRLGKGLATRKTAADYDADSQKIVAMVADFLGGLSPQAREMWPEDTQKNIAAVLRQVMEKHQWTLDDLSPEIKLLLIAGPTLLASLNRQVTPPPAQETEPPAQYNRRAEDQRGERRQQVDRRANGGDRRAVAVAHNLIRPYRWNQFKP